VSETTSVQWCDLPRDVIEVEGVDAAQFLHSQLANEIAQIPVGVTVHSLLLEPTGHVVSLLRLVRTSDERFVIDVEHGQGELVIARLRKFVLRAKLTMSLSDAVVRAFRGNEARQQLTQHDVSQEICLADPWWSDANAIDLIGSVSVLPTMGTEVTLEDIDKYRVDAAWPRMGRDIEVGDIPATTGVLPLAVSFTKGCYPGQELVERMDSRGTSAPIVVRSFPIADQGNVEGTVTSVGHNRVLARVSRQTLSGDELATCW